MAHRFPGYLLVIVLVIAMQSTIARASQSVPAVGEIITAIGEGWLVSDSGDRRVAARGELVREGDRLETGANGHVHIRFVDGGLISVRPSSRMVVEAYRNGGVRAAIKFRLENGVLRSVTGRWAESYRDRFRLNTPIAAIGVKGTDFVVKASADSTLATVIKGGIVVAPLEGDCLRTLGPCNSAKALELTAGMRDSMIEMQRREGVIEPRLVPAIDLLAQGGRGRVAPRSDGGDIAVKVEDKLTQTDVVANDVVSRIETRRQPRLVWLHNRLGWNVPDNSISERFTEALAHGREAVVGDLFVTLYRERSATGYAPEPQAASFVLKEASANYVSSGSGVSKPVQVVKGALDVDFARSSFSTRLDLQSDNRGRIEFSTSGAITSNGIMQKRAGDQTLWGALSNDGREAGYAFEKLLDDGRVSGLTLWGR